MDFIEGDPIEISEEEAKRLSAIFAEYRRAIASWTCPEDGTYEVNGKIVELKKGDVIRFGDDPSTEELMSFYKGKLYMYNEFEEIYKYFKYDHLPEKLQKISKPFCELADVVMELPDCDQKLFALQKLLEAKDCAVRCGV